MATGNLARIERRVFLQRLTAAAGGLAILVPKLVAQDTICGDGCNPDPPPPPIPPPTFWQEDDASYWNALAAGNIFQLALDNSWSDLNDYPGCISHLQIALTEWANLGNIFHMDQWIVDNENQLVDEHPNLDPVQIQVWCSQGTWWTFNVLVLGLQKKVQGVFDCATDGKVIEAAGVAALALSMYPNTRPAAAAVAKGAAWFKVLSQTLGCP